MHSSPYPQHMVAQAQDWLSILEQHETDEEVITKYKEQLGILQQQQESYDRHLRDATRMTTRSVLNKDGNYQFEHEFEHNLDSDPLEREQLRSDAEYTLGQCEEIYLRHKPPADEE